MLFFPIGTDRRLKRTPWVNYGLVAANILVFLFTERSIKQINKIVYEYHAKRANNIEDAGLLGLLNEHPVYQAYLQPEFTQLYQFFTYQFLHADLWHLLGNMVFLFVFGNAVEDRLGKLGYLLFYLAGGVVAGLAHLFTSDVPVLGASGSVSAVTGVFLALFPLVNISIGYWFVFVLGTFEVAAVFVIGLRVAQDILFQLSGIGNVAYTAHLAGYAFGFAAGMAVLLLRMLPREPYDMLALIERRRRRTQFKKLTRTGYQPWDSARPERGQAPPRSDEAAEVTPEQQALMSRRSRIGRLVADHRLSEAASAYAELLGDEPDQVMPQQTQLDVANQLMSERRYDVAAGAYELFLKTYRGYADTAQVRLILGLIYARYLDEPERARELLAAAAERLHGEDKTLAEQVLAEVAG